MASVRNASGYRYLADRHQVSLVRWCATFFALALLLVFVLCGGCAPAMGAPPTAPALELPSASEAHDAAAWVWARFGMVDHLPRVETRLEECKVGPYAFAGVELEGSCVQGYLDGDSIAADYLAHVTWIGSWRKSTLVHELNHARLGMLSPTYDTDPGHANAAAWDLGNQIQREMTF